MLKGKKAEFEFKEYMIMFLVGALFITSLYAFMKGTGDKYSEDLSIDDKKIDLTGLKNNLNNLQAKEWEQSVIADKVNTNLAIVVLVSIGQTAKLMWSAVNSIMDIFVTSAYNVLGIDPMVLGTVVAIIIILIIFAFWRVLKNG